MTAGLAHGSCPSLAPSSTTLALRPAAGGGPRSAARAGCDPIDPAHCLLPWPNDHFRKGGRLALRDSMMPRNKDGRPVRAADYNRSDGFSPGQMIVTRVPRLDLRRSRAVPVNDMAEAFAERADRGHRRENRQAPADLGGARLAGDESAQACPARASRRQLARGSALHRRAPQPQGPARPRAAPRRRLPPPAGRRRARRAHVATSGSSASLARGGSSARRALPRLGLHRRERALTVRAPAVDTRPGLRGARRHQHR